MDIEWAPYPVDTKKSVRIRVFLTATLRDVLLDLENLTQVDLTPFVTSAKQSPTEVSATVTWHNELYGANQPKPGMVMSVELEDKTHWIGIVQSINDYRVQHGERMMTIIARSRDATPAWREARRVSEAYTVSTLLDYIVKDICYALGLSEEEIKFPTVGAHVVHSNVQLADLTPWQMFETLMIASGYQPFVDARGRFTAISRDVTRPSDILLDNQRVVAVSGSKDKPAITEVRINWLDPNLWETVNQDQKLDGAVITAGFFQIRQTKDVNFSQDGTQRARSTRLVIKQSANSGLLPVCKESYDQESPTGGKIVLETTFWVPLLTTAYMIKKYMTHLMPDAGMFMGPATTGAITVGFDVLSLGHTFPIGREKQYWADAFILLTMMSIGTGVYEIWGTPYDFVHARNSTTAYNPAAQPWETNVFEIENDFVMDEPSAQAFAIRELLYAVKSVSSYNVTIVDDPRVEPGDILELEDGSRLYVQDYSRDVSPGSDAVLEVRGFRC